MYDQIRQETLFAMLYAVVTAMAMQASCYLLFRQGNAFAKDITPPRRLRRWTAAFFAAVALCHLWYLPTYFLTSSDDKMLSGLIAALLDSMTIIPLAIVVFLAMLQDRRRPLWPVALTVAPLMAGLAWCIATRSYALLPVLNVYYLLMWLGLIINMVRALRQYGRWLRDNYADLEHKEVWQSFVVLAIILLLYVIYSFDVGELSYEYAVEVVNILLVYYLLWRVETLQPLPLPRREEPGEGLPLTMRSNIGPLLQQHCEESQLYLQYNITLSQLATLIGVNRSYLSQHFSTQGITYNAYINGLRIQHFINLYNEASTNHQSVTAQQLAVQSGFRSYNTFSVAFKKMKGMTVTEWMLTQISA